MLAERGQARKSRYQPGHLTQDGVCTSGPPSDTTPEEIELLVRRFVKARGHGRGECVFTLADVQLPPSTAGISRLAPVECNSRSVAQNAKGIG